jgi:hypothetical protein
MSDISDPLPVYRHGIQPPPADPPTELLLTCRLTGAEAGYVAGALIERDISLEDFTREAVLEWAAH